MKEYDEALEKELQLIVQEILVEEKTQLLVQQILSIGSVFKKFGQTGFEWKCPLCNAYRFTFHKKHCNMQELEHGSHCIYSMARAINKIINLWGNKMKEYEEDVKKIVKEILSMNSVCSPGGSSEYYCVFCGSRSDMMKVDSAAMENLNHEKNCVYCTAQKLDKLLK